MLSIVAPVALAAAPQPGATKPTPVGGSLAGLVKAQDYPVEALDRNEQGTVGVLLKVDPTGAVSDCVVEESSGSAALDAQTCRILRLRATFTPARDDRGANVAGEFHGRVTWRLEVGEPGMPSADWTIRTMVRLKRGKPPTCTMEFAGAMKDAVAAPDCPPEVGRMTADELIPEQGAVELVNEQRFTLGREPKIVMGPGDQFGASQVARLEIDRLGQVSNCGIVETKGDFPPGFPGVCGLVEKHRYRPDPKGASPVPIVAFYVFLQYRHFETAAEPARSDPSKRQP
jgi:TonB family protein